MQKTLTTLIFILCLGVSSFAQLTGLWQVNEVLVGEERMTPVAKWFDLGDKGTIYSGNGGLRNMIGHYEYKASEKQLLFFNEADKADEYGPFMATVKGNQMTWEREEDGQTVKVSLSKTEVVPLAPWDKIVGLWKAESGKNLPFNMESIFVRWDRRFVIRTPEGRKTGVWHIDGHRAILRLISDEGDEADSRWSFEFLEDGKKMNWQREDEGIIGALVLLKQE